MHLPCCGTLHSTGKCPHHHRWDLQCTVSNSFLNRSNLLNIKKEKFRATIHHTNLLLSLSKDQHDGLLIDSMLTILSCPKHPTSRPCPDSPPPLFRVLLCVCVCGSSVSFGHPQPHVRDWIEFSQGGSNKI